jgi:hypothetical protein
MKLALTTLAAAAALAVPVAASAHHGAHHRLHALRDQRAHLFAIGTGTLTSGTFRSRVVGNGTYTAAIAATGAATTNARGSCAPAAGTVTLTASAASVTENATGKLCTASDANARVKALFVGRVTVSGATGAAAPLSGGHGLVALVQKQDGTVRLLDAVRAPRS